MGLRNLFGSGDESANTARAQQNQQNAQNAASRSRAGAAAARQGRSIGSRGTHTRVGSLQARASGTNRTIG